ncbi:hypothetical protein Patl1_21266 [Pistacia atlantica]|uniref:Uncharacterized protein n=1 Tax=Pistacia atlantica TaxID=434234 RepID=A0ACC1BKQ5_9ROSI|nr:hypothetical protein Patl1_21266 [Pistacia atlantica]
MILQMTLSVSTPSLLSSSRLNPLIFSRRRHSFRLSQWHFNVIKPRFFAVAAAENGGLPKSFDFTSEERIYNWWESQGYFKPNCEREGDPFVISMPPPNVTGSLHMGHAMFVTLEDHPMVYFMKVASLILPTVATSFWYAVKWSLLS